ncbi:MAG: acyl carrier protein [Chloroflexota bacterium]
MNQTELKQIILNALAQVAPGADVNNLDPDENVREALDIDSFDHLNFLVSLHETLGVEIPEKDYGRLNTVNEIIAYLSAVRA